MSLETKIENLTKVIADLTVNITLLNDIFIEGDKRNAKKSTPVVKAKKEKAVEPETEKAPKTVEDKVVEVSADDLKAACIRASRSEVENAKARVKALLAKFGAKVVKDVAPKDRLEIFELLEAEKF